MTLLLRRPRLYRCTLLGYCTPIGSTNVTCPPPILPDHRVVTCGYYGYAGWHFTTDSVGTRATRFPIVNTLPTAVPIPHWIVVCLPGCPPRPRSTTDTVTPAGLPVPLPCLTHLPTHPERSLPPTFPYTIYTLHACCIPPVANTLPHTTYPGWSFGCDYGRSHHTHGYSGPRTLTVPFPGYLFPDYTGRY